MRDLFDEDDGGWLQDPALLDRLVTEKLTASAEAVSSEGWKWIAVAVSFPYGHSAGMRRLTGQMCELSDEEHASREALRSEMERLEQEYAQADELPDEVDQRLGEIETALAAFEERAHDLRSLRNRACRRFHQPRQRRDFTRRARLRAARR